MTTLAAGDWSIIVGLGALWLGAQIVWVAPLPRQLRSGEVPTAARGSPQAFNLFWIDQYGYIGLTLSAAGVIGVLAGWLA
jgi:hypothetical protein